MRNNVQLFPTISLVFRAASDRIWPLIKHYWPWRYSVPIDQQYFDGDAFLAHAHATSVLLTLKTNFVLSSTLPDELTHSTRFTSNLPHLRASLHKSA